ncbi:MAG: alpha/beta hydrolase [Acidobacteria bacterium]|nr:alpha/beta hydrolase [Acidobacteriota bacterium]
MPSWQVRTFSTIIRLTVKRRPAGNEAAIVKYFRSRLDQPKLFRAPVPKGTNVKTVNQNKVKGEWVVFTEKPRLTIYYLHGGGYAAGSPGHYRPFTAALSRATNARVFALDYRLAPEHRFPAAVDDAVRGYRWLIKNGLSPDNIVIGGDSAGGGLTISTLISLRDAGERLPSAAFCFSPWTDLACTGKSMAINDNRDPMFYSEFVCRMAPVYLGFASPGNPLASPIYADLSNLPPLLIYVGSSEVLLDDSLRLSERAKECGVNVDLRVGEDLPHVWPIFVGYKIPEARAAITEVGEFIRAQTRDTGDKGNNE